MGVNGFVSFILATLVLLLPQTLATYLELSRIDSESRRFPSLMESIVRHRGGSEKSCLLIRVALFIEPSLDSHLKNNLNLNQTQTSDLMRAYMQQIETIFDGLKSNSTSKIQFELVDIYFITSKVDFSSNQGDIDTLLSKFCLYQASMREKSPRKWDLGLMLTSQDLYSGEEARYESQEASSSLMGISPVGGLEWPDLSCSIVEFGVGYKNFNMKDSSRERVFPSRGLGSIWVSAHEIAHNFGLHHDGHPFGSSCDPTKWIMAPNSYLNSMGTRWSSCSSASLDKIGTTRNLKSLCLKTEIPIRELPGQLFDAQFQCRAFSPHLSGQSIVESSICNRTLWCMTLANEKVAIGPALEGTRCGLDGGLICFKSSCQAVNRTTVSY